MRMKRWLIAGILLLAGIILPESSSAQYYSWGTDPATFRWRQMRAQLYRVVYPDTAQNIATRMMYYLDAVSPDIDYGYRHPQMSIPFVVHPANFRSNGLVMWMPRRVEFISTPATASYSMPWTKQLIAHEYRHAVQYNNLNRGVVKVLSYVIGQQSSTIGLVFMPLWMMEGDAVMTETEMSSYGRGLQPSFSMAYRAYGAEINETKNIDKWFCGSYKDFIPDHYALGYMMCRHGFNTFGRVLGDDVAWLTSRRPYMILSSSWVLKKLYGISTPRLFHDTFQALNNHWESLPEIEQTTEPIDVPEPKRYTSYRYPIPDGKRRIIAIKEDLDTPSAFIEIDSLGNERRIAFTGTLSTRPALSSSGRLWWTEYRRSTLFAEKVGSQLCYMDLEEERPRYYHGERNALYPTPIGEKGIAWVEYTMNGEYHIVVEDADNSLSNFGIPEGKEVHGLAWDNVSDALYAIITDDDGMHIARIEDDTLLRVTRPAYTTLSDLRAKDGVLYYGSIASGRDELHCYNLAQGQEYRLSSSTYGSFSPTPFDSTCVIATSYDKRGYMPVRQSLDSMIEVEYAPHPPQLLLPKSRKWNVVNLDTVRFEKSDGERVAAETKPRRFRRLRHAFNIHSWAPASYNPYSIIEESRIAFNLGATIMSQNILSNTEGFITWGWNRSEGSVFSGTLRYYGLGVTLWASGTYGGRQKLHTVYAYNPKTQELEFPDEPRIGRFYSISAGATLPLLFERGYHICQLTASVSWQFTNGKVANVNNIIFDGGKVANIRTIGYSEGVHTLLFGASFQDNVRQAHRDFLPPWGYAIAANYAMNPTTQDFGHLAMLYGKFYTPGFAKHHSLSLAAAYQTTIGGYDRSMILSDLTYKMARLVPRGFSSYDITNDNYVATSLNYQLPIWYPDGGWRGVIFFKRLRLNIGADYASFNSGTFNNLGNVVEPRHHIWSYGCDLTADFNIFGMPNAATMSATISFYMRGATNNYNLNNRPYVSFGLGLPF